MVNRIKQVMDYEQMSPTAFADKININRSSLTHIFSGRNQPSLDVAKKILTAFPEISTEWLIMGMGEMLQPVPEVEEKTVTVKTVDNMQQTDLFSGTEDEYTAPEEESVEENVQEQEQAEPEAGTPGVETTKVEVPAAKRYVAPEPAAPKEAEEVVEEIPAAESPKPEPVSRPTRGRARASESHIQAAGQRRDRISNSPSDKKLVKIVFFYDDRSFEEYRPS